VACTPCLTVWPAAFAPCSTSWAYAANVRPAVPARISANCLIFLVQLIEAIVLDPLPQ
jgi:hypothetical protein